MFWAKKKVTIKCLGNCLLNFIGENCTIRLMKGNSRTIYIFKSLLSDTSSITRSPIPFAFNNRQWLIPNNNSLKFCIIFCFLFLLTLSQPLPSSVRYRGFSALIHIAQVTYGTTIVLLAYVTRSLTMKETEIQEIYGNI